MPGWALAYSITSFSDLNGVSFATMKISSEVATSMIGSKLFTGSKAVLGASVGLVESVCAPKCKV